MERSRGSATEQRRRGPEQNGNSEGALDVDADGVGDAMLVQRDFPVYLTGPRYRRYSSYKSFRRQTREPKSLVRRLIKKNGASNVYKARTRSLWDRYWRDLGHTMVDGRWRWTMLSLSASFLLSWFLFAVVWMLIANVNSDLDAGQPAATPCLAGIVGFGGYMMFSIETQQTIGYGSRYITRHCPEGTFLMCLQIILGCAICGAMVSIVNAKMIRPFQLYSTNLFSKKAVIRLRDGTLCLMFRVRDENGRYAVGTTVSAYLVQSRPEEPFLKALALERSGLLIWPLEVVHRITPASPFYDLSARELITKRFEIIVTMQGTSASTGQCSKTRSSYLSTEILWGCAFKSCVFYSAEESCYVVNHDDFNTTYELLTPLCSAQRLGEVLHDIDATDIPYNFNPSEACAENIYTSNLREDKGEISDGVVEEDNDHYSVYDNVIELVAEDEDAISAPSAVMPLRLDVDIEELLTSLQSAIATNR